MDSEYISDNLVDKRAKAAVRLELEKRKALDAPIAVYDGETQKIYMEYSDGSRVFYRDRLRKGRYSEQVRKKT